MPGREAGQVAVALDDAARRVIASGVYLLGPELDALESEIESISGCRHVVGVGSGTDAISIALRAAGVAPGDEVVVPALTAIPTAAAVALIGAVPVLADVSESTACVTPESVAAACSPRTAAVVVVHLYGYPAPVSEVVEFAASRGILVFEDMAQAFGARTESGEMVGKAGTAACASFYPTKILAALGDAGAILTDDPDIAGRARLLRSHGHEGGYTHSVIAGNSRLDELQAAFLRVKLPYLEKWVEGRRRIAARIRNALGAAVARDDETPANATIPGVAGIQDDHPGHSYQVLAARFRERDAVRRALSDHGLDLLVHYPYSLAEQEALAPYRMNPESYPAALMWSRQELSFPTAPQITERELDAVVEVTASVLTELAE